MSIIAQKTLTILGATGSVGLSTLDLVRRNPEHFKIIALTANTSVDELAKLAIEFKAELAVIADPSKYAELQAALNGTKVRVASGESGLNEAAQESASIVMAAIVGAAGLGPTLTAVKRGATIALANKECLVCAGDLMIDQAKQSGATILPVDSEHNAIFQVFDFNAERSVEKIILTASGGPFWDKRTESLKDVTPAEAVNHPNWEMGRKISVDSATMMNKGLEVIEAFHLFPIQAEQIEVLVHPQSVVHSMVQYIDGSVLAQLGSPDMRTPIAYAISWPERMQAPVERLSLADIGDLSFVKPDFVKFPCLKQAMDALKNGGSAPIVLNAANEVAVEAFLAERIGFMDIPAVVDSALSKLDMKAPHSLSMVFELDKEARALSTTIVNTMSN